MTVLHRDVGDVVNATLMGTFPSSVEPCPSNLAGALTGPEWANGAGDRGGPLGVQGVDDNLKGHRVLGISVWALWSKGQTSWMTMFLTPGSLMKVLVHGNTRLSNRVAMTVYVMPGTVIPSALSSLRNVESCNCWGRDSSFRNCAAALKIVLISTIFNAAAQFRKLESLPQQLQDSTFLRELNADGMTVPGITYTVIATRFDNRVFPWTNTFINEPGVKNIVIQDVCPLDHSAHTDIPRTR